MALFLKKLGIEIVGFIGIATMLLGLIGFLIGIVGFIDGFSAPHPYPHPYFILFSLLACAAGIVIFLFGAIIIIFYGINPHLHFHQFPEDYEW